MLTYFYLRLDPALCKTSREKSATSTDKYYGHVTFPSQAYGHNTITTI